MIHSPRLKDQINLKGQPIIVQSARLSQVKVKIKWVASRRILRQKYKKNISWEDVKKALTRISAKNQSIKKKK